MNGLSEHGPVEFFLAVCHDCQPPLPVPFFSEAERDKWLREHIDGTGHHVSRRYEVRG